MERPLSETTDLFVGKTIESMDASCCNDIQFAFTDGSRASLHIEVDGNGLPDVLTCTDCVTIERRYPDAWYEPVPMWKRVAFPFITLGGIFGIVSAIDVICHYMGWAHS